MRKINHTEEEMNEAFSLLAKIRETLNDPRGMKSFDPDCYERWLTFCDVIEKKLREEELS